MLCTCMVNKSSSNEGPLDGIKTWEGGKEKKNSLNARGTEWISLHPINWFIGIENVQMAVSCKTGRVISTQHGEEISQVIWSIEIRVSEPLQQSDKKCQNPSRQLEQHFLALFFFKRSWNTVILLFIIIIMFIRWEIHFYWCYWKIKVPARNLEIIQIKS